jgi:hypothetical protein
VGARGKRSESGKEKDFAAVKGQALAINFARLCVFATWRETSSLETGGFTQRPKAQSVAKAN